MCLSILFLAPAQGAILEDNEYRVLYDKWLETFNKQDANDNRFAIFKENMDTIIQHNAKGLSWKLGTNEYADLTDEEFESTRLMEIPADFDVFGNATEHRDERWTEENVSTIDWSAKGKVTAVRNQGSCGSCWAFAAAGAAEGLMSRPSHVSTQQIADCTMSTNGCNGGWPHKALGYAAGKGLCSDSSYRYTSGSTGKTYTCKDSSCSKILSLRGSRSGSSESSCASLLQSRPQSTVINASNLKLYSSGVIQSCSGTSTNHAVTAVGIVNIDGKTCWKIKNSWGSSWGKGGYMYLPYGQRCKGVGSRCDMAT